MTQGASEASIGAMLTAVSTTRAHPLCGKLLTIAVADAGAIAAVREGVLSELRMRPPIHVSDHDAYLLVPPGALDEQSAGPDAAAAFLGTALVVQATVAIQRGRALLAVNERWDPLALVQDKPFDATVRLTPNANLVPQLNELPFAHCSTAARLFDRRGLERVVRQRSFVGASWAPELPDDEEGDADPTWVWSRRTSGGVAIHLAILGEYEERYALINPVRVRL